MKHVFFTSHGMAGCMCVTYHMAPGYAMGRGQAAGGSVMLWAMFYWETLGPAVHLDVTYTPTTYLSIVTDHVHLLMEMVFPVGRGSFKQDNAMCHKAKMAQERFEERNNEFEVLTWPPKFPRSQTNRASVGCVVQTSQIHGGPTSQLTGFQRFCC